jgi:hypothetical protein
LREDPAVDRLSVLAAVVAPRDPLLSQVQPQGRGWRRTLGREAVEQLFELRDQGVSFGAIATQFHVHKSTLVAISQKATKDGREAVLERYTPAATNGNGIAEGELASLITAALERRLRRWRPFPKPPKPREQRPRQVRPPRTACLRGHAFTPQNTVTRRDGSRTCRTCRRASSLAHYHRQRATTNGNGAVAACLQPDDLAALLRAALSERLAGWEPFNGNGAPAYRARSRTVATMATVVRCGNCLTLLAEPSDLPPEERAPCPECGSKSRQFEVGLTATVATQADAFQPGMTQPDEQAEAQHAGVALEDAGFNVQWLELSPGGAWMIRVFDREGKWIDGSVQDSPADALLAVAERLLPRR